jgi:hypothetical protein
MKQCLLNLTFQLLLKRRFDNYAKARFEMQTKEIKHGRIAMMAIVGFAIQEALYGIPVVNETPFFSSYILDLMKTSRSKMF